MDDSGINYGKGGTTVYGPDGIAFFRAAVIASALKLYGKTGIKANRAYTPAAMMKAAEQITGKRFKARDYRGAAEAVQLWAQTMKDALPKEFS